jgi:hypothetical protein
MVAVPVTVHPEIPAPYCRLCHCWQDGYEGLGPSFVVVHDTPDPSGEGWERWRENGWDDSCRKHAIALYEDAVREGSRLPRHHPWCRLAPAIHSASGLTILKTAAEGGDSTEPPPPGTYLIES